MANLQINQLPTATSATNTCQFAVEDSANANVTQKVTGTQVATLIGTDLFILNNANFVTMGSGAVPLYTSSGTDNTVILGVSAGTLLPNTPGSPTRATFIGYQAGKFATGAGNTYIGPSAGLGVNGSSTGANNVAIGSLAFTAATTAFSNICIGTGAGQSMTSDSSNIAIGVNALNSQAANTTNVAIGTSAGQFVSTGHNTVFVGYQAGMGTTGNGLTGNSNTAIGYQAGLKLQTTDQSNTYIGALSGSSSAGSSFNTGVGTSSLGAVTSAGNNNAAFGYLAGSGITTGTSNLACGYEADGTGTKTTTGTNNIIIGASAASGAAAAINRIIIGQGSIGTADNSILLGNSSTTTAVVVGTLMSTKTVAAVNTTATVTAAQLLGGIITTTGNTQTFTFDTAANIYAAMGSPGNAGATFECMFVNTVATSNTFAAGGTTLSLASNTLAANTSRVLKFVLTATTPTFTVYG